MQQKISIYCCQNGKQDCHCKVSFCHYVQNCLSFTQLPQYNRHRKYRVFAGAIIIFILALTAANDHFAATNVCSYNSGSDRSQAHHAVYNNMEPYTGTSCRLQQYGTIHWHIMPSTKIWNHTLAHHVVYNNMEPYTGTSCRLQQYGTIHWHIMPSTVIWNHTLTVLFPWRNSFGNSKRNKT